MAILESDIVLGRAEEMENAFKGGGEREAAIQPEQRFRWPDGVVPYVIDSDIPQPERITEAIREWNDKTIIRLVQRSGQPDYVRFRKGTPERFRNVIRRWDAWEASRS